MDLEKRLLLAQELNILLKMDTLLKPSNKKVESSVTAEIEEYIKKHLHNLLFSIMGEKSPSEFSEEEVSILKSFVLKVKNEYKGKI